MLRQSLKFLNIPEADVLHQIRKDVRHLQHQTPAHDYHSVLTFLPYGNNLTPGCVSGFQQRFL